MEVRPLALLIDNPVAMVILPSIAILCDPTKWELFFSCLLLGATHSGMVLT
jgi:hypothetical protein